MKEPVDHILRPQLPWRNGGAITECGYNAEKISTLTREAYLTRKKELGQQRCAMFTCMTCASTAERWREWDEEPREAMQRELEWEGRGGYYFGRPHERGTQLRDELLAIARLIEAHRDEFDSHINETQQRREWLARKEEKAKAKAKDGPRKAPW